MSTRHARGLAAEHIAACYLQLKNYRILDRRARTPLGEVDIVARKGDTLVLVEVKYRRTLADALSCIGYKQQSRLQRAAAYLATQHPYKTVRWDVVAMAPWSWPRHITNAWDGI